MTTTAAATSTISAPDYGLVVDGDGVITGLGRRALTPVADAEIEAHARALRGSDRSGDDGDDIDAFGRRGGIYPQLSPAAQSELALAYQRSQRLAGAAANGRIAAPIQRRARREIAQGQRNLEYLLGSVFRLVRKRTWDLAKERLGLEWASSELSELVAEATVEAVAAAATFDPEKDPRFSNHVSGHVERRIKDVLNTDAAGGTMPRAWDRLGRVAQGVTPELTRDLGRAPTIVELRSVLEERCRTYAYEHLSESERALTGDALEALIQAAMVRDGMAKALRELPQVLVASESALCLDATVGDDASGATLGDTYSATSGSGDSGFARIEDSEALHQTMALISGGLDSREAQMVLFRLGFLDGEQWTYQRIAEMFGADATNVQRMVRTAKSRALAPHAQYLYLGTFDAGSIPVEAHSEQGPAASAALRRRQRTSV